MNDFVQILIDEATIHLDGIFVETRRTGWFRDMEENKQFNHINTTRDRHNA